LLHYERIIKGWCLNCGRGDLREAKNALMLDYIIGMYIINRYTRSLCNILLVVGFSKKRYPQDWKKEPPSSSYPVWTSLPQLSEYKSYNIPILWISVLFVHSWRDILPQIPCEGSPFFN
jgi:hypothetical protein